MKRNALIVWFVIIAIFLIPARAAEPSPAVRAKESTVDQFKPIIDVVYAESRAHGLSELSAMSNAMAVAMRLVSPTTATTATTTTESTNTVAKNMAGTASANLSTNKAASGTNTPPGPVPQQ